MITVYVFLDSNNFISGWSSTEEPNSTPIEIDDLTVLDKIRMYRYESGQLVYDETKALIQAKNSKKEKAKRRSNELLEQGFPIIIADVEYVYAYDDDSKSYLNKVYELSTSGLIDEATFDLIKGDQEVSISVNKVNITELWLLSFLHEEDIKKLQAKELEKIEQAESLKEIQEIGLDKNE